MNTVNLRISGLQNASNVEVFVDGEAVAGKKNQFGSYEVRYQTEKQTWKLHYATIRNWTADFGGFSL